MSAASVLARAQAAAEALMVDTGRIRHKTGETTDAVGNVVPTYSVVYAGKCKVQQRTGIARPATVGEAEVFISRLELHIPVSVTGVASDDVFYLTATAHDSDLLGRVFHIRELAHKTWPSARRYSLIEVTS
jgi:hypothetical protein